MNRDEQDLIRNLFGKLGEAERAAPPRDVEADRFIQDSVAGQPGAPYYMAQTIIVQEQALDAAQARIQELEAQATKPQATGGFFGSLFGGGQQPARPAQRPPAYAAPAAASAAVVGGGSGPWGGGGTPSQQGTGQPGIGQQGVGQQGGYAQQGGRMGGGGGFLAGAAQTAMGVAGGVVLGSMLSNAFLGGHETPAPAEGATADASGDAGGEAAGAEPASFEDSGGGEDFGGFDEI